MAYLHDCVLAYFTGTQEEANRERPADRVLPANAAAGGSATCCQGVGDTSGVCARKDHEHDSRDRRELVGALHFASLSSGVTCCYDVLLSQMWWCRSCAGKEGCTWGHLWVCMKLG